MSRLTILVAAVLSVLAPTAHAAPDYPHERPERGTVLFVPDTNEMPAGAIMSAKELNRRGLDVDTVISASVFPSSGIIDRSSRND
ncbi:MAG: hypothetical protein MEQ74_09415 [Paracoccus sp.]|nr:hypothetical protein [Paracoccus sp. (in: a-proteobacteria)]